MICLNAVRHSCSVEKSFPTSLYSVRNATFLFRLQPCGLHFGILISTERKNLHGIKYDISFTFIIVGRCLALVYVALSGLNINDINSQKYKNL